MAGAMERCVDDKELYTMCLHSFMEDQAFDTLGKALQAGDVKASFEAAHLLKGVAANLGLIPLQEAISNIVEPLRRGEIEGMIPLYEKMMEQQHSLAEILSGESK